MRVSRVTPPKVLSAGMVVVHHDGERYRMLVIGIRGHWDFLLRPVEHGDDALEAAREEAHDHTGLLDLAFHWGEDYRETVPFPDGRVSRYYLAESATAAVTLVPPAGVDPDDIAYRWVTAEEAEEILPPRLAIVLDWVLAKLASGPAA
jgi:bis(5'-nucleosidyl)-tetraphosphatase